LRSVIRIFLPTIFSEYWFFTVYFIILLFSPFINEYLHSINRNRFKILLFTLLTIWVIIPTFARSAMYGGNVLQLFIFYLIGAYLRMYEDNIFGNKKIRYAVAIGAFGLLLLSTVVLDFLGTKMAIFQNRGKIFYVRESLLVVACATGLVAIAVYAKPFYNKFINLIGGCTFGVYLIHDNNAVRRILWKEVICASNYQASANLVLVMCLSVIMVFFVCLIIEFLRQKTIAKPFERCFDKLLSKITKKVMDKVEK